MPSDLLDLSVHSHDVSYQHDVPHIYRKALFAQGVCGFVDDGVSCRFDAQHLSDLIYIVGFDSVRVDAVKASYADFDLGTVATKLVAQYGVWIVHTDQYKGKNMIYALASVCTHLGCTPSWLEGERKFKCPCHGSGFYITGINFEGPAPRPLERVGIKLAADGMLEVDKSVKFQEEMGQWADAASFYEVTS